MCGCPVGTRGTAPVRAAAGRGACGMNLALTVLHAAGLAAICLLVASSARFWAHGLLPCHAECLPDYISNEDKLVNCPNW